MASIVAAGELGPSSRAAPLAFHGAEESQKMRHTMAAQIATLDDESHEVLKEILNERQQRGRLLSSYQRTCNSERGAAESKLPKKPDSEYGPLVKLAYSYLPILTWWRTLTVRGVRNDIIAGLTVGVMVIPQSMSYAAIAGLEYKYGMYSAMIPTIVYALFGQSRQLAVGPVAMVSLLVQSGLAGILTEEDCPSYFAQTGPEEDWSPQAELCPDQYAAVAFLASLLVGVFQLVGSMLNFGALVNLLGHPVTSGFTSGAAIIIGLSQVKYFLGYDLPKSQVVYVTVHNIILRLGETNGMTLFLGLTWFIYLYGNKQLAKKYKLSLMGAMGPLISCVVGILLLWLVEPLRHDFHVKYIGSIPSGFPPMSIHLWDLGKIGAILPTALTATLIGFMESIAIGKNLATKHGYSLEAGQEMFALGAANFVGAMFSCYPVTGSFSRSAVANATGSTSQLCGLVTGLVMLATLLFLTKLFYFLPKFVLAAVVISSIIPLIAFEEAVKLWTIKRRDCLLWVVAFLGTLFLGVLWGIAVAVILSLLIVIFESVRPQITVLWRIPGTTIYRGMKQENKGAFIPNVFVCRIGSSMYFANASYIKDTLMQYVDDLAEVNQIKYIILEMTPVVSIDSTAVHIVEDIHSDFKSRGVQLAFAMVGNRVLKTMHKSGARKHIGEEWFFETVHDAVSGCVRHQLLMQRTSPKGANGTEQEDSLNLEDIGVKNCTEVGFSNDYDAHSTVIFITLAKDVPMIMSEIAALFRKHSVSIHKCEIEPLPDDGAKHIYHVRSARTQVQLIEFECERLKEELEGLFSFGESVIGQSSLDSRALPRQDNSRVFGELERRFRDQDQKLEQKLDKMHELLAQHAQTRDRPPTSAPGGRCAPVLGRICIGAPTEGP